jgi:hypothetical protein
MLSRWCKGKISFHHLLIHFSSFLQERENRGRKGEEKTAKSGINVERRKLRDERNSQLAG